MLSKTKHALAVGVGLAALIAGFGLSARPATAFSTAAPQSHLGQSVFDRDNNNRDSNNGRRNNDHNAVNFHDYRRSFDRDAQRRREEELRRRHDEEVRLERERQKRRRHEHRSDNRNRDDRR